MANAFIPFDFARFVTLSDESYDLLIAYYKHFNVLAFPCFGSRLIIFIILKA